MSGTLNTGADVVVALCAIVTVVIALRARKTLQTIHVLVNSNMTAAVKEITELRAALELQKHLPAEDEEHAPE